MPDASDSEVPELEESEVEESLPPLTAFDSCASAAAISSDVARWSCVSDVMTSTTSKFSVVENGYTAIS